mgnify:CR=1 FL=1
MTDIVFIDPPGTGFSHLIGKADPKDYYGVTQDAKLVAQVIRRWLNDNGRWNSAKFLGGESYGTTRSAAVANELMNDTYNDVGLNGIILISTVLDFAAGADTPGNELSYITNLPSMATTALYHGKATAASPEAFAEEARQWAIGPYASAFLKGQKLQDYVNDLVGGQVNALFDTVATMSFVSSGKLKVLGVGSTKPVARSPGVVPISKSGVPALADFTAGGWSGMFLPASTPTDLQKKIYADVRAVLETKDVHDAILKAGLEPSIMSQADFATYLKKDLDTWGPVIRERKIRLD